MTDELNSIFSTIKNRRTIYPPAYSDRKLDKKDIEKILEAATWAPNHGNTEPWRFFVFQNASRQGLADFLGEEYKKQFQGDLYNDRKYSNASTWPALAQAVIAVGMKRTINSKIPAIEEERAVACAIQNMLLMASELGIASYWSTGKVVYSKAMKTFLKLEEFDEVIGLLYFAYPKEKPLIKNRTTYTKYTQWYDEL
jgi:nitroreductase